VVILEDLRYSKEHIWVRVDDDNRLTIGVTDYYQEEIGEVVGVDLPEEGDELVKDEVFGSLESTRSVADLYTPVSGEVIETNDELLDSPELINEDPYQDGWIIRAEMSSSRELDELLNAEEYEEYLKEFIKEEEIPGEEEEDLE
jgi:glycine cleavage system H protein